jgi:glyoxylase-like metal-dependent hydrolase (beta-lactamase superfamily II)
MTAEELFERLTGPAPPRVLDVRNAEEFARWRVEGGAPVELLHIPYFEFIEDEEGATRRVETWLGGRAGELAVVCAEGGSSQFVADLLQGRGIAAANLEGGMVAWGLASAAHPVPDMGALRAWQVLRFGRGCLSYVVAQGEDAIVVDPHRATDAFQALLDRERLRLRAVFETHLHADHVSGGPALARAAGVACHAHPADFEGGTVPIEPFGDGTRLRVGGLEVLPVVTLHTPGHTPGSAALLVNERLLLSGDTLFVDGVGRPDLGGHAAEWARDLYRTLHQRLAGLPDGVAVLPAHAASLQGLRPGGVIGGRLGTVRRDNAVLGLDEAAFVDRARAAAGSAPAEYVRIRRINLGREAAAEAELVELELGKNQCALSGGSR